MSSSCARLCRIVFHALAIFFAGRLCEVANWKFYWFNWIICSRRLFSAFCGNATPQQKNERNHIFCILIFLRLLIHWNRKHTNRAILKPIKKYWKIKNAFESAHFILSFVEVKPVCRHAIQMCSGKPQDQHLFALQYSRVTWASFFILFLHIMNNSRCTLWEYTRHSTHIGCHEYQAQSIRPSLLLTCFFFFSTVQSFHLKQQRAAAYIYLKRERIDGQTKKKCSTSMHHILDVSCARSDTAAAGSRSQWFICLCMCVKWCANVKLTGWRIRRVDRDREK